METRYHYLLLLGNAIMLFHLWIISDFYQPVSPNSSNVIWSHFHEKRFNLTNRTITIQWRTNYFYRDAFSGSEQDHFLHVLRRNVNLYLWRQKKRQMYCYSAAEIHLIIHREDYLNRNTFFSVRSQRCTRALSPSFIILPWLTDLIKIYQHRMMHLGKEKSPGRTHFGRILILLEVKQRRLHGL